MDLVSAGDPGRSRPVSVDGQLASQLEAALLGHDAEQATVLARLLCDEGATLTTVIDEVLVPLLQREGARSATGEVPLAGVRQLSFTTALMLARLVPQRRRPSRGTVVLAAPPFERHLLGAQAVAAVLVEAGWTCLFVGDSDLADLVRWCAQLHPAPAVVGITLGAPPSDPAALRQALHSLRSAIPTTSVLLGGAAVSADPGLAPRLGVDAVARSAAEAVTAVDRLSRSLDGLEVDVLRLIATGHTNGQVARTLNLSPSQVKALLSKIFVSLQVTDRAAAAAEAVRRGWA